MSPTYRLDQSLYTSASLHPVRLSVDILANPKNVTYQWYFNPEETHWEVITSSDVYTLSVLNQGMTSVLTIKKFTVNLKGRYRLDVTNGVGPVKQFQFTFKAEGNLFQQPLKVNHTYL